MPASASISELTVTCNQCGSASLERLDRKEYRCNHCGAITLISDNDADRIEALLRDALAKQSWFAPYQVGYGTPVTASMSPTQRRRFLAAMAVLIGIAIAGLIFVSRPANPNVTIGKNVYIGGGSSSGYVAPKSIPLGEVTLSPLQWIGGKEGPIPMGKYHALLYNHSGSTINVPDFGMTFYPGGMKGDTAIFNHDVMHLLPGEYTHVTFRTLDIKDVHARYEVDAPSRIESSVEELVRLPVEQAQLVRQEGQSDCQFIGLLRNTLKRNLAYASVGVVVYGPDHQLLGGGGGAVSALRPGEKAAVYVSIDIDEHAPPVRTYEYLVDAVLERRP